MTSYLPAKIAFLRPSEIRRPGLEETYKAVRNQLRRYNASSLVELALSELWKETGSSVELLRTFPWFTLLLVKWALQDKLTHMRIGPDISQQVIERLRQTLWNAQDGSEARAENKNIWLMMRSLIYVQICFQQPPTVSFLRWPALYARLPHGHKCRKQFRAAMGMEPDVYMDLTFGLYAAVLNKDVPFGPEWFRPLHTKYGEDVERIIELFSKDLVGLREALQADAAHRISGRNELYEFPYLKRFPLLRLKDGMVHCWHPLVFARGVEDAVHLRLAEQYGKDYADSFSRVFEEYVVELVDEAGLPHVSEEELKKEMGGHFKAVEAVIELDCCNIFVEAKMSLFADDVVLQDSEKVAHQKMKRVRNAIGQGWAVGSLVRNHPGYGDRFKKPEDFLIVVTSRELFVGGGHGLQRLFAEGEFNYPDGEAEALLPLSNVFIVSIGDFERVIGCVRTGEVDLADALRKAAAANKEPQTARLFLSDFLKEHTNRWTSSRLVSETREAVEARVIEALGGAGERNEG